MTTYRAECFECGTKFPAASAEARYCSGRCRSRSFRRRRQAAEAAEARRVRRIEEALAAVGVAIADV